MAQNSYVTVGAVNNVYKDLYERIQGLGGMWDVKGDTPWTSFFALRASTNGDVWNISDISQKPTDIKDVKVGTNLACKLTYSNVTLDNNPSSANYWRKYWMVVSGALDIAATTRAGLVKLGTDNETSTTGTSLVRSLHLNSSNQAQVTVPVASTASFGVMTTGAQSLAGNKTFTGNVNVSGDVTVGGKINATIEGATSEIKVYPSLSSESELPIALRYGDSATDSEGRMSHKIYNEKLSYVKNGGNGFKLKGGTTTKTLEVTTNAAFSGQGDLTISNESSSPQTLQLSSSLYVGGSGSGSVTVKSSTNGNTTIVGPSGGTINLPANPSANNQVFTSNSGTPGWTAMDTTNTANAIVKRDSSGNFSAGTITATLDGSANKISTTTASADAYHNLMVSDNASGSTSDTAKVMSDLKVTKSSQQFSIRGTNGTSGDTYLSVHGGGVYAETPNGTLMSIINKGSVSTGLFLEGSSDYRSKITSTTDSVKISRTNASGVSDLTSLSVKGSVSVESTTGSGSANITLPGGSTAALVGGTYTSVVTKVPITTWSGAFGSDDNVPTEKLVKNGLSNKSDIGHTHIISDVTNLQSTLDNKASLSHEHGDITNDGKLTTAARALVTGSDKKITTSSVTSTELGYLSGVTSAVQTQLNNKADDIHVHGNIGNDGKLGIASRAVITNEDKKVTVSSVTSTELGYLSGVTSGIQAQLNNRASLSHEHGDITNDGKLTTAARALVTGSDKKITTSSVTSTELGYLSGVTSGIQSQLNDKASTSHDHTISNITGLQDALNAKADKTHGHGNITNDGKLTTASMVVITGTDKKITTSNISTTKLGYLSGVTSSIQSQLNGKADTTKALVLDNSTIPEYSTTHNIKVYQQGGSNASVSVTPEMLTFSNEREQTNLHVGVNRYTLYVETRDDPDAVTYVAADRFLGTADFADSVPWDGITGGPVITTVTVPYNGWGSSTTQVVTVQGMTASANVMIAPTADSMTEANTCGVYCSAQASSSLTFTCMITPLKNLTFNLWFK